MSDFGKAEDGEDATVALDDPSVIDFVTQAPDGDVVLIMVEGRRWDGSTERLQELHDTVSRRSQSPLAPRAQAIVERRGRWWLQRRNAPDSDARRRA